MRRRRFRAPRRPSRRPRRDAARRHRRVVRLRVFVALAHRAARLPQRTTPEPLEAERCVLNSRSASARASASAASNASGASGGEAARAPRRRVARRERGGGGGGDQPRLPGGGPQRRSSGDSRRARRPRAWETRRRDSRRACPRPARRPRRSVSRRRSGEARPRNARRGEKERVEKSAGASRRLAGDARAAAGGEHARARVSAEHHAACSSRPPAGGARSECFSECFSFRSAFVSPRRPNGASHGVGSAPRKSQPKSCTAHVSGGNAARPGVSVPVFFVDSPDARRERPQVRASRERLGGTPPPPR